MKKAAEEKPRTVVDVVSARFEKISRARDEGNVKAREAIKRLEAARGPLLAKRGDLEKRIAGMTAEYRQLLAETAAEEETRIKDGAIVEEDLKAGRVTAAQFLQFGKKREAIAAEAQQAAEEKLGKVRDAIRTLRGKVYEFDAPLADLAEKIGFQFRQIGELFYFQLEAMRRELLAAGIGGGGAHTLHFGKQEADNNLAMATKGVSLWHAKTWKITIVEEAELLSLDPIVQPGHFAGLRSFIDSNFKGKDFTEATVAYSPSDMPGRPAGFWLMSLKNLG